MKNEEYIRISRMIREPSDIKKLSNELNLSKEFLLVIYTQKVTRSAMKKYHKIKDDSKKLLNMWKDGRSILSISKKIKFPPVLTAYMILSEMGIGRKRFWKYMKKPEEIDDERLKKEITEVLKKDIVYSPMGCEIQWKRGKIGEKRLYEYLDKKKINYLKENELKKMGDSYPKTPDALFHKPVLLLGYEINWIESKASFGDLIEIKRNVKKQLLPYVRLFGPGIVVYWYGFVEDVIPPKGIYIVDSSFFDVEF